MNNDSNQSDPASTTEPEPQPTDPLSKPTDSDDSLGFAQVLGSTLAAAFGVQSSSNRKRDFTRGKAWQFILMGIGFTVLFVMTIVFIVNTVLS